MEDEEWALRWAADPYVMHQSLNGTYLRSSIARNTSTPCLKGSVLLCLMQRRAIEGAVWLSKAKSDRLRCTSGSYAWVVGTVNSPARRNPKNPTHAAAHSMMWSGCPGAESHTSFSCRRMVIVIGNLVRVREPE